MIRKIEFENFMSLKHVSVELGPLTVFIGANASGKSAIFKGLVTLSKLLKGQPLRGPRGEFTLESGVTLDDLVWQGNAGLPIRFRVWFTDDSDDKPGYSVEIRKGPEGWSVTREMIHTSNGSIEVDRDKPFEHPTEQRGIKSHNPPLRAVLRYLVHPYVNDAAARPVIEPILQLSEKVGSAWRYRPSASDIAGFVGFPTETERKLYVAPNGWGVAGRLQELQGSKRKVFESIETALCTLFPHIKSLGFQTDWQGVRLSFMTDRSEQSIPAPQESDGVLLATFLLWRLYTGGPVLSICLEEPENGLHPLLLAERFLLLKKFAYPDGDRPAAQLLVATHSPEFLRAVRAHPQALYREIRIVEFDPENGTSVRCLNSFREAKGLIGKYLDEMNEHWSSVIEAWDEAALSGGSPP